jgi:haloacetate dehalogenase
MSDLADLFPGFASHWIDTEIGRIFARSHGEGPPVVLIHGFPQTHVMWHAIAPALARTHKVVCLDLRGYGWSSAPEGDGGRELYTKRAMARDVIAVMEELGHIRFAVVGHDRGARVGYRLALDHPGRVERLALLDILPTLSMWEEMDAKRAMKVYHWTLLAQPAPIPEKMIGADPLAYIDHTLASWTAVKNLSAFSPRALAHYRAYFNNPDRIHANCEDYRAGATSDLAHDRTSRDAGQHILCPTLVLWGDSGIPSENGGPLEAWRNTFAPRAEGKLIKGGHFIAEENMAETLAALAGFLGD